MLGQLGYDYTVMYCKLYGKIAEKWYPNQLPWNLKQNPPYNPNDM